jgi:hypothetical protein
MSTDDEIDVRQRLDRAFGTLTAHPAPVEQTIKQGGQMRSRRRKAALAGLAVVAAVAVAVPFTLLGRAPARPHLLARQHVVTVHPAAARQARKEGLIAWGSVDGEFWQLRVNNPDSAGLQCVLGMLVNAKCGNGLKLSGHEPAKLGKFYQATRHGRVTFVYGPVSVDVTYVKVSLTTGTVLTLHPVPVEGVRQVGFAAPRGTIGRVTAYSRRGVLATLKIVVWSP